MKKNKDSMIGYRLFKFILSPIFKLYYRPTIIGKENIPNDGPVLIAGNHKHLYDQCLAVIATKRPIHYMAKREYFDGKTAWFFKLCGCIPVDRSIKDDNAKGKAIEVLNSGLALGIFPEGTRNKTDKFMLPFKFGAVSLAQKTDATIIPFGLTGDYKFGSKNLTIRFGKPFKVNDMDLETANKLLEQEVETLMKTNLEK